MLSRRFIAVFCAGAFLAGCSGGSLPLPGFGGDARTTSALRATPKKKDGKIHFRIRVPKKLKRDRHGRQHYVSPATQGLVVAIACTGVGCSTNVNETVALTINSSGCSSSLATTVCTFTYLLPPGGYSATLTTYDNISGCPSACTIPGGANELSTAQAIAFTVDAGVTNSVALTLSGVPASIVALPLGSSSVLNVARGIDLFGTASRSILVEALDADGNIIFGAGSPTFTVALGTGSLNLALGQPTPTQPNIFTVTPPSAFSANNRTVNITAAYTGQPTNGCAASGAVCSGSTVFDMKELFATQTYAQAFVYETGDLAPYATIAGVNNLNVNAGANNGIAFDGSGDLYLTICNVGCGNGAQPDAIAIFAPPYNGNPTLLTRGIVDPHALAFNAAGQLFVGNCGTCNLGGTDTVTIYTPPFSASSQPATTITSGIIDPQSLVFDNKTPPNLFVADCASCAPGGTDAITEYASPYTGSATTLAGASLSYPVSLAVDSANDIFVANTNNGGGGGFVTGYVAPGYTFASTITESAASQTFDDPVALWTDVGGTDIFIADNGNSQVYECGPAFTTQCGSGLTITTDVNGPTALLEDGVGNLYVANNGANNLASYPAGTFSPATTISTTGNTPFGLAVLP